MPAISLKLTESQKRLLILVPIGLIFIWVGWILAARPAVAKIRNLRTAISTTGERSALIAEIQSLKKKQGETEPWLATEEARHEILAKLTSLAKQSGFVLQSLTPSAEPGEPYGRLIFSLKAQASFPALIWFLSKVRDLKPGVAVYEMSMNRTQTWRRSGLANEAPQIELTLETYLK
jgi:hypothetical protein